MMLSLCAAAGLAAGAAQARPAALSGPTVVCHVDYGGETFHISAPPVDSPYGVKPVPVGSYFLFRVVNQTRPADLASVKVYTYADQEAGPAPIHQAQYSPAQVQQQPVRGGHGFTGQHWVYEPLRDGELRYWCERIHTPLKGQP
jgi:hypothetical protein